MAHFEQLQFFSLVKDRFPESFRNCRVLEVGSWDKNGSVRALFESCDYVGTDVGPGPGVDIVCPGQDLTLPSQSFDTVISGECFEHNRFWFQTFLNMIRMLKAGGLAIVTCAGPGRTEHGTQRMMADSSLTSVLSLPDYYRNLRPADFLSRLDLSAHFTAWVFVTNVYHRDLYFLGAKTGLAKEDPAPRIAAVANAARGITPLPKPSLLATTRVHLSFGLRYSLSRLLGEKRYHDTEYRVRRLVNRYRRAP